MEPAFTWLDFTARDREKMRRVLDLFGEQGTVDELGLGTIRDALADALFPGTSSIQTRLRYMLFIPWIYMDLEKRRVASDDVAYQARKGELSLIEPLKNSDDNFGVIGAVAGHSLARLPSHVYWSGLVRWRIFLQSKTQSWYHTHFTSLSRSRDDVGRTDDPGIAETSPHTWHPRMPKPPEGFPEGISFALTSNEADFIRGRIEESCAGTLLAWLSREGSKHPAESFWEDPDALRAPGSIHEVLDLARRFSLHVEGAPLVYNLLLAERRHAEQGTDADNIEAYRDEMARWAAAEEAEPAFDPNELWVFLARIGARVPESQHSFVEEWSNRVAELGAGRLADDGTIRDRIERRELELKGGRARLANSGRLLDWSGSAGVGRMDFRWFRVRQLIADLHAGLAS